MSEIHVPRQFRGPPISANGGYISGLLAKAVGGRGQAMLRALIPLDADLALQPGDDGAVTLLGLEGQPIGSARPALATELPEPPTPPSIEAARAAQEGSVFAKRPLHRGCFSCCVEREDGEGLGVHVGQVEGAPEGQCAGLWTPHANFADADGTVPDEITWAALDCPGSMCWHIKTNGHAGLLGSMVGEVLERPRAGQTYVVSAWTQESEGRKFFSGVALHDADGKLLARGNQIWIARAPTPPPAAS